MEHDYDQEINMIEILLVEDNAGDVRLTKEAFKAGKIHVQLTVVTDGSEGDELFEKRGPFRRCEKAGHSLAGPESAPKKRTGSAC